jgi:hypothetical protein
MDAARLHLAAKDAIAAQKLDPSSRSASVLLEDVQVELSHCSSEQSQTMTTADVSDQKRLLSDALKERGNQAMTVKDFAGAFHLYSEALGTDALNTGALNNRALALLKLERFSEAVDDSSEVIRRVDSNTQSRIKALARRSEAYRGLSQTQTTHAASPSSLELLALAATDLDSILVLDPSNQAAKTKKSIFLTTGTQFIDAQPEVCGGFGNQFGELKERILTKKATHVVTQPDTSTPLKAPGLSTAITTPVSARTAKKAKALGVMSPMAAAAVPAIPPKNSYE